MNKLKPQGDERLLEIGCGTGYILTPVSEKVAECIGLDHPKMLEKYRELGVPENVRLIAGEFPKVRPEGQFDLIYIYGVMNCFSDSKIADEIIDTALDMLNPNGRLLLGDLPNLDLKTYGTFFSTYNFPKI